jgi:two-component system sensor histidine kinase BaeS
VATLEHRLSSATSESSARGTSLSITMHELRRPLTILNSYGQLLSAGMLGELPETAIVAIEGITASTEMMVRMVNALAELTRLEDPDDHLALEVMDAEEVVAEAIEHVAMEAKLRESTITSECEHGLTVKGDRRRVILAITNLLGNAVKHGPMGSPIEVLAAREGESVRFTVRDHGTGFPVADTGHLFDKYFRSVAERQRKVPGSGLGLYIVRTVAERHGGTVAARSVPGSGAEFDMTIPLHREEVTA